ncbi:MAG: aminopeptidase family protein P [Alphaproteobacteria bacterium]|nr:aminopeptidase family protein P [Alphaproteobacteria bacterium]
MHNFTEHLETFHRHLRERHVHGMIVPHADCFQGEYVAPCDERLAWITGFTGSAGLAIILEHKAALFVDGRYTLQAQKQVSAHSFDILPLTPACIGEWLATYSHPGKIILYDPWLHTINQITEWEKRGHQYGFTLQPCAHNPIDLLWDGRPDRPKSRIHPHPIEWSGEESHAKRHRVSKILHNAKVDAVILASPESVAWLLNIRGDDVPHVPVAHAFAILHADASMDVFVDLHKVDHDVRTYCGDTIRWHCMTKFIDYFPALENQQIMLDPSKVPVKVSMDLDHLGINVIYADDPSVLPRAIKNTTELKGAHAAHRRDAIAMIHFLSWLSKNAEKEQITELDAAAYLLAQRRAQPLFQNLSFGTISAAGPNAAIIHYQPTPTSNAPIKTGQLYLVDSGGQYPDGTTDITRTVAIGAPTAEHKDRYTRVLRGHIALAQAVFPRGTSGYQLDGFARQYLWEAGLDYDHGTGHGVGSYLNVHEGPQGISKRPSNATLQPGMILSNEPGYYKPGEYGIRIENLMTVVQSSHRQDALEFETLTLVPLDRNLIDLDQLTTTDCAWVNTYHAHIYKHLSPLVQGSPLEWLRQSTHPL